MFFSASGYSPSTAQIIKASIMSRQSVYTSTPESSASTPLARALDQNEIVMDTVAQSAVELVMISTVLKQEIPTHVKIGDVAQALQKTDELESKIKDTTQDLAQVNEVLAREIEERAALERELARTKAALAQVTINSRPGLDSGS